MSTINSKSWIINLCFSWIQCSIYCCIVSLLRLPSITFCKIKSLRWVSWSAILDSYVTFVTFFRWPTYPAVSIQRIKFGRNSTYESVVAFLPHLIELNSTRQKCDVWTGPLQSSISYCTQGMFVIFLVQPTSPRNSETRRKHLSLYRTLFTSSVFFLLTHD